MELSESEKTMLRLQSSLQKFIDTVDNLELEDDPSGDGFTREFRVLRELGLQMREENTHPAEEGRKPYNIKKNRYKDILPFDETRVVLDEIEGEPGSDYINANFIKGYNGYETYIATQGPLPGTVNDFWRMVWQNQVRVITMACRLVELGKKKCEQYWPSEVKETQTFGNVAVTLVSEEDFADHCTKRMLSVKCGGEQRVITQFQYTGWPDHDIPNDIEDILEMIALMRNIKAQHPNVPVVIHCSAGCGRTGTICAIDYAWDELKSGKLTEDFNLYNIVKTMREQRQSMIQAPEQYKCAHVAIKLFFEKHQQMMEDHTYGNIEFGENDEDDFGYVDPKSLKKKVSAMVDDIESTLKELTEGKNSDPTPVLVPQPAAPIIVPQPVAPVAKAPPPQKPAPASRPPSLSKPDLARKPSIESPTAKAASPLSPGKQSVFPVEKIENIPAAKGNLPHKPVLASTADKHDTTLNKQQPQYAMSNKGVEPKRGSIKAKKEIFEANNNGLVKSQPPTQERPVLQRIESKQSEDKKFSTVISIGGATGAKPDASRSLSNPIHSNAQMNQQPIQKSKTLPPNKNQPAVYVVPQSSVPPSTPTKPADNVYSYAAEPGSDHYSSLSTYSSVGGAEKPVVSPVVYNGVEDVSMGAGQGGGAGADVYAEVNKAPAQLKPTSQSDGNVYESVAVGNVKSPPPIPDRNYVEDEKSTTTEKPGSQDNLNTMGRKGKLDTLKQMFTGGKGSGGSDVTTSSIPGFKTRLGVKPKGPKQKPMTWAATTKM